MGYYGTMIIDKNKEGAWRIADIIKGYWHTQVYYFYNKSDTELQMIMAEVTNTPWNERHCYFITNKKSKSFNQDYKKEFHVAPFWGMDHDYNWNFSIPDKSISVHMQNFKDSNKIFDATLTLDR